MNIANKQLYMGHQQAYLNPEILLKDPEWKAIAKDRTNTIGWMNFIDHSRFNVMEDHNDGSVFHYLDRVEYCKELCKRIPFKVENPYSLSPELFKQVFNFSCDSIAFSMILADWHQKHIYNPLIHKYIDIIFSIDIQFELEQKLKLQYAGINFVFTTSRLNEIYKFISPKKTTKANAQSIDNFKNALKAYKNNLNKELIETPILDFVVEKPIGMLLSTLGKHDDNMPYITKH